MPSNPKTTIECVASHVRTELRAQHDILRALMDRCEQLSGGLHCDRDTSIQLPREVARLRIALDVHNKYEELLLRPLLLAKGAFTSACIDRMMGDHIDERRLARARVDMTGAGMPPAAIATLRTLLDTEEAYLLPAAGSHAVM